jgi:predicted nucleic acid-binding protein
VKVVTGIDATALPGNLGAGEREAISLMARAEADWLLMDDQVASTTARLLGLRVRSLAYLVVYLVARGVLGDDEGSALLDDLVDSGYYLGSRDYLTIKKLLNKASKKG